MTAAEPRSPSQASVSAENISVDRTTARADAQSRLKITPIAFYGKLLNVLS
jgi:hypothetical protein